ncbi:MAG: putative zinc-binding protein [Candidatus Cloacimonetes bacterium]|nr:putative zinc-binding protein [Candidatus Cloacimonadota bacterium]
MTECNCSCSSACAVNTAHSNVYACAGASNVGKISVELAIALHKANKYRMGCAAGVGADICGFKEAAEETETANLVIDGCAVSCLKNMFDKKEIGNYQHIILTEFGIEKEPHFDYDQNVIKRLVEQIDDVKRAK